MKLHAKIDDKVIGLGIYYDSPLGWLHPVFDSHMIQLILLNLRLAVTW